MESARAIGLAVMTILINIGLMLVKILTGIFGNSFALIADGLESASDIFTSLLTWVGYHLSLRPPDEKHPFGHGKIESLTGIFSGLVLLGAGLGIAVMSIREIRNPHHVPEWYTLPVLLLVVVVKETMSRRILLLAGEVDSRSLEGDAWHHRSDAITSGAAAVGLTLALVGGEKWASGDDWGALVACVVIVANAVRILSHSLHETLDGNVDSPLIQEISVAAAQTPGVEGIEKCLLRKSGIQFFAELHVEVDPNMSVRKGHELGHQVKDHLMKLYPQLIDVVVHLEPTDELE
jgi:cation diffusion facilitator family transporter